MIDLVFNMFNVSNDTDLSIRNKTLPMSDYQRSPSKTIIDGTDIHLTKCASVPACGPVRLDTGLLGKYVNKCNIGTHSSIIIFNTILLIKSPCHRLRVILGVS